MRAAKEHLLLLDLLEKPKAIQDYTLDPGGEVKNYAYVELEIFEE